MALIVGVLPVPVNHLAITAPYARASPKENNFLFYVLGLEFSLLAGKTITEEERAGSISANSARPIIMVDSRLCLGIMPWM
jgi:hypothetical protein